MGYYEQMGQLFDWGKGETVVNAIMDLPPEEGIQKLTDLFLEAWRPQVETLATRIVVDLNDTRYNRLEKSNDRVWRIIRNVHNLMEGRLKIDK